MAYGRFLAFQPHLLVFTWYCLVSNPSTQSSPITSPTPRVLRFTVTYDIKDKGRGMCAGEVWILWRRRPSTDRFLYLAGHRPDSTNCVWGRHALRLRMTYRVKCQALAETVKPLFPGQPARTITSSAGASRDDSGEFFTFFLFFVRIIEI